MVGCRHCEGLERQFGRKTAARDLRRFQRRGALPTTRLLIGRLEEAGIGGASLLDIGGGVGAVHHVLLDEGARDAVHVDVSADYIDVARAEAGRRAHGDRVRFVQGDFVRLADRVADADVVTLDRVICCYPDMPLLVGRSAAKARRLYGAVYPRGAWWMRVGLSAVNAIMRLRRSPFRVYLHAPLSIDGVLRERGFERWSVQRTVAWEVAVYVRREALAGVNVSAAVPCDRHR
jgi:magnesium-protoporphyrin O-methyltransferase